MSYAICHMRYVISRSPRCFEVIKVRSGRPLPAMGILDRRFNETLGSFLLKQVDAIYKLDFLTVVNGELTASLLATCIGAFPPERGCAVFAFLIHRIEIDVKLA